MYSGRMKRQGTASAVPKNANKINGLYRLRKNSILVGFVTGHDFSRADKSQPGIPALAAAILILLKTNVAGAKAHFLFAVSAARLKSCPVTKRQKQCANRVFPQPV